MKNINRIITEEIERFLFETEESHIIDMLKNGYIAHGTPIKDITEFNDEHIKGGNRGEYGYGFYFTDALYKCLGYGNNIYFTPKSIYNFLDLDNKKGNFKKIVNDYKTLINDLTIFQNNLDDSNNEKEYEYWDNKVETLFKFLKKYDVSLMKVILMSVKKCKNPNNDEDIYKTVIHCTLPSNEVKKMSQFLLSIGYDGVKCGNQYCIFNTKKLKAMIDNLAPNYIC